MSHGHEILVAGQARARQSHTLDVLYLDYDGVLHVEDVWRHPKRGVHLGTKHSGHTLFEHAGLLVELLKPYPSVKVVLSTSWVRQLSYSAALQRLPPALAQRVIGATFHTRMDAALFAAMSRGAQVVSDVGRRRPREWLAIDDDSDGWPPAHLNRLVLTDPELGIAHPSAQGRLIDELARRFGPTGTEKGPLK